MFLNHNILKRLMKQAYKTGLAAAQTEERLYLAGNYWEMDVKREFLPKQILAQLIELAGEIPDKGTRFKATKDGNQIEIEMGMSVDTEGFERTLEVSNLILMGSNGVAQRLLQYPDTGEVYIVNNAFVCIADNAAVEEEKGEYRVEMPQFNPAKGILWQNNVARFRAMWRSDEQHQRLLDDIRKVDIAEDPVE